MARQFRLYGDIEKVTAQEDGTLIVSGIASSEAVDGDGEVIKGDAMRAAIPDYLKFGAVREMHSNIAAGTALSIDVDDQNKTHFEAHVVDAGSVKKIEAGVLKGFSVGGKITSWDPSNKKIITGIKLNEISLVDRPCNPEAVFSIAKFEGEEIWDAQTALQALGMIQMLIDKEAAEPDESPEQIEALRAALAALKTFVASEIQEENGEVSLEKPAEKVAEREDVNPKAGENKYGDVTFADEKNKKYPIDTEEHIRAAWNYINKPKNAGKYSPADVEKIKARIVAAWKKKIDKDGPPSASEKEASMDAEDLTKASPESHAALLDVHKAFGAFGVAHKEACSKMEEVAKLHKNMAASLRKFGKAYGVAEGDLPPGDDEKPEEGEDKKPEEKEEAIKEDAEKLAKLAGEKDALLAKVETMQKRIDELEAIPAASPLDKVIALEKSKDTPEAIKEEKKLTPEQEVFELTKIAMRNPRPFRG